MDFVGTEMHDVDISHFRMGQTPDKTETTSMNRDEKFTFETLKTEVKEMPGCQLIGTFPVRKAPGNFHISFHSSFQYYDFLVNKEKFNINLEYTINTLRLQFPDMINMKTNRAFQNYIKNHDKDFLDHANAASYKKEKDVEKNGKFIGEHLLNIYPVLLSDHKLNESFEFHKYTFVKNFKSLASNEQMMPNVVFKMKFLPFIEEITVQDKGIVRTIINIFAICGGVFAIFSLLETFLTTVCKYLCDLLL